MYILLKTFINNIPNSQKEYEIGRGENIVNKEDGTEKISIGYSHRFKNAECENIEVDRIETKDIGGYVNTYCPNINNLHIDFNMKDLIPSDYKVETQIYFNATINATEKIKNIDNYNLSSIKKIKIGNAIYELVNENI